jgi:hypothetical protein
VVNLASFLFEGRKLGFVELAAAVLGEGEELLELPGGEGGVLAGALDFDEGIVVEHGDVHVDMGVDVFEIVEIADWCPVDDADGDGGDLAGEGVGGFFEEADSLCVGDGIGDGDPGAGDGGGAGAAVGLEDVAVDEEGQARAAVGADELLEVDAGAEGAADEALDFNGAAILLRGVPAFSCVGGGGEHAVFSGEPTTGAGAFGAEPRGEVFFEHRGAQDLGVAEGDEDGAAGVPGEVAFYFEGAKVGGGAIVVTFG